MAGARDHPDRQKLEDAVRQIIPELTREDSSSLVTPPGESYPPLCTQLGLCITHLHTAAHGSFKRKACIVRKGLRIMQLRNGRDKRAR